MFIIEVTCGIMFCFGLPDLSQRYRTLRECHAAIGRLVNEWKPPVSSKDDYVYIWNCRAETPAYRA